MSTSRAYVPRQQAGFGVVELLVGMCLTVGLALALLPLWANLQGGASGWADRGLALAQSRVAVARLEKDLRLASAAGCRFAVQWPVLEASPRQVVLLRPADGGNGPIVVEWELSGGSLMRRWGPCPAGRPGAFPHALYLDSKTMIEGVAPESRFSYVVDGAAVDTPIGRADLAAVESVVLTARVEGRGDRGFFELVASSTVGR